MSPLEAKDWTLIIGLTVAILAGAAMLVVSVRTGWISKKIAWMTLLYGLVGGGFVLSPKWTELVIRYDKFEAKIAQLEGELLLARNEREALSSQISQVTQLNSTHFKSAADLIGAWGQVQTETTWANFVPADPRTAMVEVFGGETKNAKFIAEKLGVTPDNLFAAVKESGSVLLTSANPDELRAVPADFVWLRPQTGGK